MTLFVIPCKYDGNPLVIDCVARIRKHHPDADVLIVDSCSDDLSYLSLCRPDEVQHGNRHYMNGAFAAAYRTHPAETVFHLIADSLLLNAPLPDPDPLVTVRWFGSPPHPWGWDQHGASLELWGIQQLEILGVPCPPAYRGVFGPMFSATREVLDDLDRLGYWNLLPTDKYQQCAMERVTGIVLEHLGYDVTVSLQGPHLGHFDDYADDYVTKVNAGRL